MAMTELSKHSQGGGAMARPALTRSRFLTAG
jgi:hypothetical protein